MQRIVVEARIKEILKRSTDTHNIHTPFELCEEMLGKVELKSEMKVMVMFNLEFVWLLKEKIGLENVWFMTPCELKKRAAIGMGVDENHIVKYSYNKKEIEGEENMPKFDCVIQNPPYLGTLHLKFLELGYDLLSNNGKMVILHPSSWLILLREGKTKQKYDLLKSKISKSVQIIEFFPADKWFPDISPYAPLEILVIDKTNTNNAIDFLWNNTIKQIKSLNDANLIGDYIIIKSIEKKIDDKQLKSIKDFINVSRGSFFVNVSGLVGNGCMKVMFFDGIERTFKNKFNLVNNTSNKVTTTPVYAKSQSKNKLIGNLKQYISFGTCGEAQNFLDFITKSKLCKYLLIAYNIDQHIESVFHLIPWLQWNKSMNDNDIYEYFNFAKEEINLIEDIVDGWKAE